MRRKSLRALSLTLSTVMVLSVANPGVTALATEANSAIEQQVEASASGDATTEAATTEEVATEAVTTEAVTEDVTTEVTTEEVTTEAVNVEDNVEPVAETTEDSADEVTVEVDKKRLQVQKAGNELVSTVITDAVLAEMVLAAYNTGAVTKLTLDNFTVSDLAAYEGSLILEGTNAGQVRSVKGLGVAKKATEIDISACDNVTRIEAEEFKDCKFTTFKMPTSITVIGQEAFYQCVNMTSIYTGETANTLPVGLVLLGQHAFQGNTSLKTITIPTLEDEGAVGAFLYCYNLESVTLGNGVTKVPVSAFESAGITSENGLQITFGTGLDKILDRAFCDTKFKPGTLDLSMCTSITGIDAHAFRRAVNLNTIILPTSLLGGNTLEIGAYAFAETSLQAMYPSGLEYNGIYLPDYTAATLGDGAFFGNTTMTAVSLSPSLGAIRDYTFDGCSALGTADQRQDSNGSCNVKWIGDCAFRGTAITNTEFLLEMIQLEQIGRQLHDTIDYQSNSKEVYSIPLGGIDKTNKDLDVTNPTQKKYRSKYVGSEVFKDCVGLTTITIPSSVKVIAQRAFYFDEKEANSQVVSVTWERSSSIVGGVERKIWAEAFAGNYNLQEVVLPENRGESLVIGAAAFRNNVLLEKVGSESSTDNTLPNTLSYLGRSAFRNCQSLLEVHIQSYNGGMPYLDVQTFEGCWSMKEATLPSQTTVIPYHFFGGCPLESFNFNEMTNLIEIQELVFVGNQFTEVDLSACTKLKELGAGSFAYKDTVEKNYMTPTSNYQIKINGSMAPKLTTMILPQNVENGLHIDSALFAYQAVFDTMYKSGSIVAGQVVIPSYVLSDNGNAQGVFRSSGVSKVVWEADTDPSAANNRWTAVGANMYAGCEKIQDAKDVLPLYVEYIHKCAFMASNIVSADLSGFTSLRQLGVGNVNGSSKGVFYYCENLETVKFPATTPEKNGIVLMEETFKNATLLRDVDLGAVTELKDSAFALCPSLESIDLKNVKVIGSKAFYVCSALSTINFGMVNTIGDNAFEKCSALTLVNNPFPNTLEKIGGNAFKTSGVTSVDFSNATALTTIGANAFEDTPITMFDISGTQVSVIPNRMLYNCLNLTEARFGEEIEYISENALAGCPKFSTLVFYATTTVDEGIFKAKNADGVISGYENGRTKDDNIKIQVNVKTPQQVVIPLDREMNFPYYVNKKGTSNISYISIVDAAAKEDLTVEELLFVQAKTNSGYYKGENSNKGDGAYKVSSEYYEHLSVAPTVSKNKQTVDVIRVKGLKESAERDLQFNIYADIRFTTANDTVSIEPSTFWANYRVKIVDPKTHGVLYSDADLIAPTPMTDNIQVTKANMDLRYYYDLVDEIVTDAERNNYNLIIETSNPEVLYPGLGTYASSTTMYTTKATTMNSRGELTTDKRKMYFNLIPVGVGTATITIYPEESTEQQRNLYKRTYTFTVNSDVKRISLAIPSAYRSETKPGDEFSVFSNYETYLGQKCSAENILDFNKLTNQSIVFTSDAPDYASVDALGNVKILKADGQAKSVKIKAIAFNSNGATVETTCTLKVKYPTVKANTEVKDEASGATVKVTKPSTTDLQGEVAYQGPTDSNTTQITVPDTVTINGVQYKVTTIKDNLFKNNKKVTQIKIGSYVKEIKKEAFSGCIALKSVTIGDGVEKIDQKAFYGCKKLKTVTISSKSKLKTIGVSAFQNCTALTKVNIPKAVEKIDQKAFYGCKKLKTVSMSSSGKLKTIGVSAFQNCTALTKITIPKAVETINQKAFYNCKKLATVSVNKSGKLSMIGASAFEKCVKLKSIVLPSKFKTLGAKAFSGCKALKTITIKSSSLKSVGMDAFKGIYKKATIKVPKKKLSYYKNLLKDKGQKSTVKIKKG